MTEIAEARKQEIRQRFAELKRSGMSEAEVEAALSTEFSVDSATVQQVVAETPPAPDPDEDKPA